MLLAIKGLSAVIRDRKVGLQQQQQQVSGITKGQVCVMGVES